MKNVGKRFISIAIIYGLLGMGFGIWMGMTQSLASAPLHTHINLIGWASFAIFGLIYRAFPALAESKLAAAHFWVANLGAVTFIAGIVIVMPTGNMLPVAVGALIMLISMIIFAVNFWQNARG